MMDFFDECFTQSSVRDMDADVVLAEDRMFITESGSYQLFHHGTLVIAVNSISIGLWGSNFENFATNRERFCAVDSLFTEILRVFKPADGGTLNIPYFIMSQMPNQIKDTIRTLEEKKTAFTTFTRNVRGHRYVTAVVYRLRDLQPIPSYVARCFEDSLFSWSKRDMKVKNEVDPNFRHRENQGEETDYLWTTENEFGSATVPKNRDEKMFRMYEEWSWQMRLFTISQKHGYSCDNETCRDSCGSAKRKRDE